VGYWANNPVLSRTEIEITGPASDIETIVKGICYFDLSERRSSYNESMAITLLNAEGAQVDSSVLYGQMASVSVSQSILKTKELPILATDALLGTDSLPVNYEILEVKVIPSTVTVAGAPGLLEQLENLKVESIDVSGRAESLLANAKLILPSGVSLLSSEAISVYVNIVERSAELKLEQMPIRIRNLPEKEKSSAALNVEVCDAIVYGRISLMSLLDRSDVELYVDVKDLHPGVYELPVMVDLPSDEMLAELNWELSMPMVTVSITGEIREDLES